MFNHHSFNSLGIISGSTTRKVGIISWSGSNDAFLEDVNRCKIITRRLASLKSSIQIESLPREPSLSSTCHYSDFGA